MPSDRSNEQIIILAPEGGDATAMAALLHGHGFPAGICTSAAEVSRQILAGAGALLLTEEALGLPNVPDLFELLRGQPPWSELPVIILINAGRSRLPRLVDITVMAAGSVTLLERPLGGETLLHSVEVALRSRRRQYHVRDLLEAQLGKQRELEEVQETLRRGKEFNEEVMNNMAEGLYTVDSEGLVTFMNPAAERLFGWTLAELRGRKMHDITHYQHPDGSPFPAEDCAALQVLRAGRILTGHEDAFIRKDGTFFDVVYSSSPIREGGKTIGLVVVFHDVTDRKRAEEAKARLAAVVESSADAIITKDLTGTITSWNQGAERLFGFSAREAIGRPITIIIPSERRNEEPAILQRIRQGERIEHFETVRRCKDGRTMDISLTVSPIVDAQRRIVGASKIARDITSRKRMETALVKAQAKLAEHAANLEQTVAERTRALVATNEQLETFVYSIAHDLRAPLRSMNGYSQLLLDDYAAGLEESAQHLLKRIQASSEFMDRLLLDLLAYGRTARAEMALGPVELRRAWETALYQCTTQIEQTQAQVEMVEPLPTVRAHEATLGQCLANLLSNALKFTTAGVRPEVRCRAEENGDSVRVWVEDNGIGIPANQHERVFRVFERLNGARYQGTGIGLSIVRKGIERMGGRVGFESEPGKGSRFWIELPKPKHSDSLPERRINNSPFGEDVALSSKKLEC